MINFDSRKYWEDRYVSGRNSGAGSYGRLAEFKAEYINKFIDENSIESMTEFGSGDGNQLKLFEIDKYIGLDVSPTIVKKCIEEFSSDKSKSFFAIDIDAYHDGIGIMKSDIALSLDVIYHLVEDSTFERYMQLLFNAAESYVIVYASNVANEETENESPHVKHRKFTDYVGSTFKDWLLMDTIKNKYPYADDPDNQSFADFYVYKKK